MNVHALLMSLRLRVLLGAVLSTLVFGAKAWGQTFVLTPGVSTANTFASPTITTYTTGQSTTTTWTLSGNCENGIGNANNFCEFSAQLGAAGANPLQVVTAHFTLAGAECKSTTPPGTYDVPLTTSAAVLFQQVRKNGSVCVASGLTFTVSSLTYTAYTSSATNYTRGVTIQFILRP